MLQLKRNKNSKISISLKPKSSLWTPDFALAIGVAFLIHAFFFVFFRIELGSFLISKEQGKSFFVTSDNAHPLIVSLEKQEIQIPHYLISKKPPLPSSFFEPEIKLNQPLPTPLSFDLSMFDDPTMTTSHFSLSSGLEFVKKPDTITFDKPCMAKLEFKEKEGVIFWIDWKEKTGCQKVDAQIIEALKASQLKASSYISHGTIEVDFRI